MRAVYSSQDLGAPCPSADECIRKTWCMYTMEYSSARKRNRIGAFVMMWMNLESAIHSEVSQKERERKKKKSKYYVLEHRYEI